MSNDFSLYNKIHNESHLPVINYRIGTYSTFLESMYKSIPTKSALERWTNRQPNDWGVVLMEMWAYLADILSYYQERIANEAFLNTSVLDESSIESFYLINYKPIPGLASSSLVQFEANENMKETIPEKFKIQGSSKDGPLIFETNAPVDISDDTNLMQLDGSRILSNLEKGQTSLILDKVYPNLHENDFILITDGEHEQIIEIIQTKNEKDHTEIVWGNLDFLERDYDIRATKIYKFLKTVRPFGYDAHPQTKGIIKAKLYANIKSILGDVKENIPTPDLKIELLDGVSKNIIATTISDQYGNFNFREIFPGTYKLRIKRTDDFWLPGRWRTRTTSMFQVFPSHEIKLDAVIKSLEFLSDSGIEYRKEFQLIVQSNDSFDVVSQDLISSDIFLNDKHYDLKSNSLAIFLKDSMEPFDKDSQVYRIHDTDIYEHLEYGVKKDVSRLNLVDLNDNSTLDFAFIWDDIPEFIPKPKSRLRSKIGKFLKEKSTASAKGLQKEISKTVDAQVKSTVGDVQSDLGDQIKEVGGDELAEIASETDSITKPFGKGLKVKHPKEIIPKDESAKAMSNLFQFLSKKIGLEWVDKLGVDNIIKINKENKILVFDKNHFMLIKLNDDKTHGQLFVNDTSTFDLICMLKDDEKIHLYWDVIQANRFRKRNTSILLNPTFELKIDPRAPSFEKTQKGNKLILDGHKSLRAGSFLSITDNASVIKGQLFDNELHPLSAYKMKIYQIHIKDNEKLYKSLPINPPQITDKNGYFEFNDIISNEYILFSFLSTNAYWERYLSTISGLNPEIHQKVMRVVLDESNNKIDRAIKTSSKIITTLIYYIGDVIENQTQKIKFLGTNIDLSIKSLLFSAIRLVTPLSNFNNQINSLDKALKKEDLETQQKLSETISGRIIPKIVEDTDDLINKTKNFEKLISNIKASDVPLRMSKIIQNLLSSTEIIKESCRLVRVTLDKSVSSEDRNDCLVGHTYNLIVKPNQIVKLTMSTDFTNEIGYTSNVLEQKRLETVLVVNIGFSSGKSSVVVEPPLNNSYVKGFTEIRSNIVYAYHGETVSNEILGSGNASIPFQKFILEKSPLTYISSYQNPTEIESSLQVFVDGILWNEKSDFFDSGPADKDYVTSINEDSQTMIIFGDGTNGSRLPTGNNNIMATYRIGLGPSGNIKAGKIDTPLDNSSALKSITNPLSATGGYEQPPSQQKEWALAEIKTLGRAVTLEDYNDLTLTTTFIGKAKTSKIIEGGIEMIKLVVAPIGKTPLNNFQKFKLRKFLDKRRDKNVPMKIESFKPVPLDVVVEIQVKENYVRSRVVNSLREILKPGKTLEGKYTLFSFENLDFGKSVALSDLYEMIENIEGIKFTVVKKFARRDSSYDVQDVIKIKDDEIIQCEDDLNDPTKGTIEIISSGGILT